MIVIVYISSVTRDLRSVARRRALKLSRRSDRPAVLATLCVYPCFSHHRDFLRAALAWRERDKHYASPITHQPTFGHVSRARARINSALALTPQETSRGERRSRSVVECTRPDFVGSPGSYRRIRRRSGATEFRLRSC